MINPHQRCGYSDSPFARRDTFLYCRVQKWVGKGSRRWAGTQPKKLYLRKRYFYVMEKYIEYSRQDEKDVPDLLESIMKGSGLVKEESRPILFKINTFRPEIPQIRVLSRRLKFQNGFVDHLRHFLKRPTPFRDIWPH